MLERGRKELCCHKLAPLGVSVSLCHKDTQHLSGLVKTISTSSSNSSNSQLLPAKQPAFSPPPKTAEIWVIGLDPAKQKDHGISRDFFKSK